MRGWREHSRRFLSLALLAWIVGPVVPLSLCLLVMQADPAPEGCGAHVQAAQAGAHARADGASGNTLRGAQAGMPDKPPCCGDPTATCCREDGQELSQSSPDPKPATPPAAAPGFATACEAGGAIPSAPMCCEHVEPERRAGLGPLGLRYVLRA